MTAAQCEVLLRADIHDQVWSHVESDPQIFALQYGGQSPDVALIATQIKYLQRCKRKIPAFYAARCILTPKAFEQASSQQAASMKEARGKRCLDLSAGLGVDTWHFSQHFEEVLALESDPVLARITRHNLNRLAAHNVSLQTLPAEVFVQTYQGPAFDLIYVDPDRRDPKDRRMVDPEGLSPNVLALLPQLRQMGKNIWIKMSPLLDLEEAAKLFGPAAIHVISVNNEVKEVLIKIGVATPPLSGIHLELFRNGRMWRFGLTEDFEGSSQFAAADEPFDYVLEPDVAVYKARALPEWFHTYFPDLDGYLNHPMGYFFSKEAPEDFPGRVFRIREVLPFKPKLLKKWLSREKISGFQVARRHFPLTVAQIRNKLNLPAQGPEYLLATTDTAGALKVIWAELVGPA